MHNLGGLDAGCEFSIPAKDYSTTMVRHFACLNLATVRTQRVRCPRRMAVHTPDVDEPPGRLQRRTETDWNDDLRNERDVERASRVAGTLQPPVYVRATVMKNPEMLRYRRSSLPMFTTIGILQAEDARAAARE